MSTARKTIEAHLASSPHFVSVEFLDNFQKDHDNSLIHKTDVYKGMIVTVKPEYVLSSADIMWLHPNIAQCRAVYEGGVYQSTEELPPMNASVGIYQTRNIDAIGNEVNDTYTIVDTHLRQSWKGPVQSIYSNKYQTEVLAKCKEQADCMGAGDLVSASYTNMLYKGVGDFHFYNTAYKDKGLVLVSPLVGYKMVDAKNHISDLIDESTHLSNLSRSAMESIYARCDWEGNELINTYAFKQSTGDIAGTHYRPLQISVSSTPIHKYLSLQQHIDMTPLAENVPDGQKMHEYAQEDEIKVPYTAKTMQQLLDLRDEFDVINMYDNKFLTLPRHIVERILSKETI